MLPVCSLPVATGFLSLVQTLEAPAARTSERFSSDACVGARLRRVPARVILSRSRVDGTDSKVGESGKDLDRVD